MDQNSHQLLKPETEEKGKLLALGTIFKQPLSSYLKHFKASQIQTHKFFSVMQLSIPFK